MAEYIGAPAGCPELKYHVYSDSVRAQIMEHTEYNYVTAALYCVGEELENLVRTNRQTEQTHR